MVLSHGYNAIREQITKMLLITNDETRLLLKKQH